MKAGVIGLGDMGSGLAKTLSKTDSQQQALISAINA